MGILIDSTALIAAERQSWSPSEFVADAIERWGDPQLAISVMSAGELLHGCWRADSAARRARREEFVDGLLGVVPVVAITLPVIRIFAELDASLAARGRRIPTSDLLIASTALHRGDEVVTGNRRHFSVVPGLVVRDMPTD